MEKLRTGFRRERCCLALAILALAARPGAAQRYAVYELPPLPGGTISCATGINAQNLVVGWSDASRLFFDHAVVWNDTGPQDLGILPEGTASRANALNGNGQIVGFSNDEDDISRAFCRQFPGRRMEELKLPDSDASQAFGINASGKIVGWTARQEERPVGFVYEPICPPRVYLLGTLSGGQSVAYGINDAGAVVGSTSVWVGDTLEEHAALWEPPRYTEPGQDLGTLGGAFSSALAINESGTVVGWSTLEDGNLQAFAWDAWSGFQELETLGGPKSSAQAINELGDIVGYSWTELGGYEDRHAVLWSQGRIYDLNSTLVDEGSGEKWLLQEATGINASGIVVGNGMHGSATRGFLLVPL